MAKKQFCSRSNLQGPKKNASLTLTFDLGPKNFVLEVYLGLRQTSKMKRYAK